MIKKMRQNFDMIKQDKFTRHTSLDTITENNIFPIHQTKINGYSKLELLKKIFPDIQEINSLLWCMNSTLDKRSTVKMDFEIAVFDNGSIALLPSGIDLKEPVTINVDGKVFKTNVLVASIAHSIIALSGASYRATRHNTERGFDFHLALSDWIIDMQLSLENQDDCFSEEERY